MNDSQAYLVANRILGGVLGSDALFVDGTTVVPDAEQTGSIINPYRTINQALDTISSATTAEEARNVHLIIIAPHDYDEDLDIDITGKRILLLSWGPWGLGTFEGVDWGPSGTPRNITISGAGTPISGIRPGFGIGTFEQLGRRFSTHQSYFTGARISGDILFTAAGGGSIEVDLECEVFGVVDASGTNPILQTYLYNGRYRGDVDIGSNGQLQHAQGVRFNGALSVGAYSHLEDCRLDGNFATLTAANAGLRPDGFVNCQFTGATTFDGPEGSFRLDSYTDYWVQTNNVSLAGGATKVLLDPQGKIFVRNETGVALSRGQLVYIDGYDNPTDLPLVELALADDETTARAIGMVLDPIANNANGWVVRAGIVMGLNTSAFADGDPIWLSPTVAGAFQDTQPGAPDFSTFIGYVLEAAGGTNGSILVTISDAQRETGEVFHFGADFPDTGSQGDYFTAHGTSSAAPVATLDSDSEIVVPNGGQLAMFSWNSVSANPGPPPASRTTFTILVNGVVVETIQVTGVSGAVALTSGTVLALGDTLAVEYDSGDAPGRSTAEVQLL